jgi:ADP-ribose pyrophosphatase YjhB (NUDIX family)
MADAARAIIIENNRLLVMERIKNNQRYYTLVGGRQNESESIEECLIREVFEETGLRILSYAKAYYEPHTEPYNNQHIFVCTVEQHSGIQLDELSEEALLNKNPYQENRHTPMWVPLSSFASLPFRTPQLQERIVKALKKGFPREVQNLR